MTPPAPDRAADAMTACTGARFCPGGGVNGGVSQCMERDTGALLRSRLRVFAPLMSLIEALGAIRFLVLSPIGAAVPALLAVVSGVVAVLLWSRRELSCNALRLLKHLLFGGLVAGLGLNLYLLLGASLTAGDQAAFLSLINRIPGLWLMVIFAYTVFVSETWKQALAFVLVCVGADLAGALALRMQFGSIVGLVGESEFIEVASFGALLLLAGGGIGVFGTHVLNTYRRSLAETNEAGMYHLIDRLGVGGMGEVWRAEHRLLARRAAIKMIRPELLQVGGTVAPDVVRGRFEREARATAALQSPHTVQLYDYGVAADGTFFYVMELLNGVDLQELVQRFGPLSSSRVVHVLRQAAESLHEAHQRGMVHRDIKPANIHLGHLAGQYDWVKVLDFGLVRSFETGPSDPQLTREGATTGTPAFFPPEMSLEGSVADSRSDVYALAAVGYWLLTGQLVFEGAGPMDMIIKHVKEEPVPPSQRTEIAVSAGLERAILAGLAKAPDDRPQSMRAFADLLRQEAIVPPWTQENAARWWQLHLPEAVEPLVA